MTATNTQPKTLALSAREWNAFFALNASDLAQFFQGQPAPTPESFQQVTQHLERMLQVLPAWLASAPVAAGNTQAGQAQEAAAPQAQPNGAAPQERKKGGWPKGKKRERKAPAQAVQ